MLNKEDIVINCRRCGRDFVFTKAEQEFYEQKGFSPPRRCKECRSISQTEPFHINCSGCRTKIDNGTSVYCYSCLEKIELESKHKIRRMQEILDSKCAELLVSETENAELKDSLEREHRLVNELEQRVNVLNSELDKLNQLYSGLNQWFQPTLNGIEVRLEERLETLESGQSKINERILQLFQKMHEMYTKTNLLDIIKQRLKHRPKQDEQLL